MPRNVDDKKTVISRTKKTTKEKKPKKVVEEKEEEEEEEEKLKLRKELVELKQEKERRSISKRQEKLGTYEAPLKTHIYLLMFMIVVAVFELVFSIQYYKMSGMHPGIEYVDKWLNFYTHLMIFSIVFGLIGNQTYEKKRADYLSGSEEIGEGLAKVYESSVVDFWIIGNFVVPGFLFIFIAKSFPTFGSGSTIVVAIFISILWQLLEYVIVLSSQHSKQPTKETSWNSIVDILINIIGVYLAKYFIGLV